MLCQEATEAFAPQCEKVSQEGDWRCKQFFHHRWGVKEVPGTRWKHSPGWQWCTQRTATPGDSHVTQDSCCHGTAFTRGKILEWKFHPLGPLDQIWWHACSSSCSASSSNLESHISSPRSAQLCPIPRSRKLATMSVEAGGTKQPTLSGHPSTVMPSEVPPDIPAAVSPVPNPAHLRLCPP